MVHMPRLAGNQTGQGREGSGAPPGRSPGLCDGPVTDEEEKVRLFRVIAALALGIPAAAQAACPPVTMADLQGIPKGAYPQQYELDAFQKAAKCEMVFAGNPDIGNLNARIRGNPALPPVTARLPAEPLVVIPYGSIGSYGGRLRAMSNAAQAGTSDVLSLRHVNLVRYADDLQTIVPNVARAWTWNAEFTELTFTLRKGHKWSDGRPFTSADVRFWYVNLVLDPNIHPQPPDYALAGGKPMVVETPDAETVVFRLAAPKPGLLIHFATSFAQGFQPRHFLGQFHPDINPDADRLAQSLGFENGYAAVRAYYGNSDWTDTPTPLAGDPDRRARLPADVTPTLESHVLVSDTQTGRQLVANPYYFQIDPSGQQLPYIDEQDEVYVNDNGDRIRRLTSGAVDYKAQSVRLETAPVLLENQEAGGYVIQLKPTVAMPALSFNFTAPDPVKRALFNDLEFRRAMSVAIDRDRINQEAYFGQGVPSQVAPINPAPVFVDPKWASYEIAFDPDRAAALLNGAGLADTDGDGFRELPNGEPLELVLKFALQGIAGKVVALIAEDWSAAGVRTRVEEVSTEDYFAAQSANELDVSLWQYGAPMAIHLGLGSYFRAPFGTYSEHRTGMEWGTWFETGGAGGIAPPDWVRVLARDIAAFQSAVPGSEESNRLGAELVQVFVENLAMIGTVQAVEPIYHSKRLRNFTEFRTWSYEYYRTYPYRPAQWWLEK